MLLVEQQGDLFESGLPAIAHGCNTAGVMGAGVAKTVAERYLSVFQVYRDRCQHKQFMLGDCLPVYVPPQNGGSLIVFNLATQGPPGRNANLTAITISVHSMLMDAARLGINKIGIPRIGCGIGGLDWETEVRPALLLLTSRRWADLVVYTL